MQNMDIRRFKDIPQYKPVGLWESAYDMVGLVRFIKELQKDEGLILEPKYKLKTLWCEGRQKDYLEYVLRGGKEGVTIYLNNPSWSNHVAKKTLDFELVDGLQRYKAVEKYLNNEIKVFGKYFKEMEGSSRLMRGLRVNINNLHIPEDVIQWYVELNSGVSIHSKDDLQLLLLK